MKVKDAQKIASGVGVKVRGLSKEERIRAIQKAEGNFDCFGTAKDYCDQVNCLFRRDCLR